MIADSDFLLGVDLGTSGCKVVALSTGGAVLASAEARYAISSPRPGWAEQDPSAWLRAVRTAMGELLEQLSGTGSPLGIGVTGQMHTLVALDAAGEVVRPAILWSDRRSGPDAQRIAERVGSDALLRITRNPSRAAFTASKLVWLRANEPQSFDRVRHVLLPKDWLVLQLTGRIATEPSDASGTALFDVATGVWSGELLDALELDRSLLPEVVPSDSVVGGLTEAAAASLGLRPGIPVIAGAGDQAAAAYDAGAIRPGVVACNLGTSIVLMTSVETPVPGSLSHVVAGQWLYLTSAHSGTIALDWWSRVAGTGQVRDLLELAARSAPGARGARFVPLLLGSRDGTTPGSASGSFSGLREDHSSADLARAVVDGVGLEVRSIARDLPSSGPGTGWRIFGGGARGGLLLQTIADVLQTELHVLPAASSAAGAARLAGIPSGATLPPAEAANDAVRPDPGTSYDEAFAEYREHVD